MNYEVNSISDIFITNKNIDIKFSEHDTVIE